MARTIDIDLNPTLAKDVPAFGRVTPIMRDMRNVRYIDTGEVRKRPGSQEKWDTLVDEPIIFLMPEDSGYAIDRAGNIFILGDDIGNIFTLSVVSSRPTYIKYNNKFIVATGNPVIEIDRTSVSLVGNDIPAARFVVLVNDYALYLGYHPTEFMSSVPGNPKSVDVSFGSRRYNIQDNGTMQNAIDHNENLFIFKEKDTEVWTFRGSDPPFVRQPGAKIDKGLGAPSSLVKADNRLWFYGHDGDFYVLEGFVPVKISSNYRAEIDGATDPTAWEGYDVAKENLVMWINRASGKTLSWDYRKEKWLEDNWWNAGCWETLPFSSYMELGPKHVQYFGSAKYDGKVLEWSYDFKDDNGDPIRVSREFTVPLTQRGFNARVSKLRFRRKAGQGNSSVPDPVFMVRTNFDGEGWSNYEHLTLGVEGDHNPIVAMDNIGVGREMTIEIVQTDAVDFLLTNIYATVQAGKH